jgi:ankyrin repeat protein
MLGDGRQVRTLCELGADINAIDGTGQSLLHLAARRYSSWLGSAAPVSVIMALIHLGLDVDAEDHHGETPLHKACKSGGNSTEGSRILLQHGADVHHKNKDGESPLSILEGFWKNSVDWGNQPEDSSLWFHHKEIWEDQRDVEAQLKVLRKYDPRNQR